MLTNRMFTSHFLKMCKDAKLGDMPHIFITQVQADLVKMSSKCVERSTNEAIQTAMHGKEDTGTVQATTLSQMQLI